MTNEQIKGQCEIFYSVFPDERIVDICVDVIEENTIISVASVSVCHVVWKRWFYIDGNELHFIKCECM